MYWLFYATLILGISIHEIACCTQFLLQTLLENPKQLKFPLFWACIFTNLSLAVGISTLADTAYWRIYNLITPQTLEQTNVWMVRNSLIGGICGGCMVYGLAVVILLRTLKVYQHQSHWFRYYTFIMTGILTLGFAGTVITVPMVFSAGINYPASPFYKFYVISGGFFLNFPASIHIVISAFVFLSMIYSAKGFTMKEFLKDWILRQDGFRYVIILGLTSFNLYCFFVSTFYGQNNTTVMMFYTTYWLVSAALMTFMENSYVTTKAVLNSSGSKTTQQNKSISPNNVFLSTHSSSYV